MQMFHDLKTWPEPFQAVWTGIKTCEFRKNDRNFQVDDDLRLREYDPETGEYSGDVIYAKITHVARHGKFGIPEGYCMLSIKIKLLSESKGVISTYDS